MQKTARHSSADSCNRCEQDNSTLFVLLQRCNSSNETLLLVPKWASNYAGNRNSISLINALVSNNSKQQLKSLKHQVNIFFAETLGLDSRDICDTKKPMLGHGIGKSAKEELEELLEPRDADYSKKSSVSSTRLW